MKFFKIFQNKDTFIAFLLGGLSWSTIYFILQFLKIVNLYLEGKVILGE